MSLSVKNDFQSTSANNRLAFSSSPKSLSEPVIEVAELTMQHLTNHLRGSVGKAVTALKTRGVNGFALKKGNNEIVTGFIKQTDVKNMSSDKLPEIVNNVTFKYKNLSKGVQEYFDNESLIIFQ